MRKHGLILIGEGETKMTRAENILKEIEEKGLLKAALKGAAYGAGSAIVIHLGKKVLGKKDKLDKKSSQHTASRRRAGYYD